MFMSADKNAGRIHNINIDNSSFERVEEFRYLGTIVTNQNSLQEKIKSRLNSGNVCCHSVRNLLSSSLLSKNLNINVLKPNDIYICRTAALISRRYILNIYSTNIHTEYLNMLHNLRFFFSSKCHLFHNATLFGSCIIRILPAGCAKI